MQRRLALLGVLVLAACKAEQGGALQLQDSPVPDSTCITTAETTTVNSTGFLDPHGIAGYAEAYHLSLRLVNNMITPQDDTATSFDRDVRPAANDVILVGFNVCWDLASRYQGLGSADSGLPFHCDSLPNAQRAYTADSGTIASGGGKLVTSIDVLSLQAMQAPGIFGPDFFPADLPTQTRYVTTVAQPAFALPITNSACEQDANHDCAATRSGNWGDFPQVADNKATIIVIAQAVGKTQDGTPTLSNWLVFPIEVCVG